MRKIVHIFDSVEETMSDDAAAIAINYMSDYLERYYGKKVIILLDEYDTPLSGGLCSWILERTYCICQKLV